MSKKRRQPVQQQAQQCREVFSITPDLKSANQVRAWQAYKRSDVLIMLGPPGCGKTFLAACMAVDNYCREGDKVTILRPAVEAVGERLGFLPGDLEAKIDPFLRPVRIELEKVCASYRVGFRCPPLETLSFAHLRGANLYGMVVVDEAQNLTREQLRLVLGRMCKGTKVILTGDPEQSDIGKSSYLLEMANRLTHLNGVSVVRFDPAETQRHTLVPQIMEALQ